jgi:hypothetical protein
MLLLAGLSAVALAAGPQPGLDSAVGVLIGIEHRREDVVGAPAGTLHTLWIEMEGKAPLTAARTVQVSDLFVPRQSGFWQSGRVATCAEGEYDEPGQIAVTISQYLWAVPAGQRPSIRFGPPSYATIPPAPERLGPCRATKVHCDVRHRVGLHWVAPDYISIETTGDGTCGSSAIGSFADTTRRLDDVDKPVTVADALGTAADAALRTAYDVARLEYEKAHKDKACEPSKFDPAVWWIAREDGRFKVKGWSENHRLCGYGFDFSAEIDVSRVTGRTDDRARWQTLRARRPDITDAHVAPGGRWTVARTERQLLVLDGDAATPALILPIGRRDDIVMVEWATGRNVARWGAEIRRVRALPALRPVVVK